MIDAYFRMSGSSFTSRRTSRRSWLFHEDPCERRLQILDDLDREKRGLAPFLLYLLGEPLELLLVLRAERQEVDRILERDRTDRPKAPPRLHAEARRMHRKAENQ